jgi:hypothetical protein
MQHLFNSTVRAEELQRTVIDGEQAMSWSQATSGDPYGDFALTRLPCRIDMGFLRPGKDIAPAPEAGKAPDRIGVMFCAAWVPIRAGMRFVTVPNDDGSMPVAGTFELRVNPDGAIGFRDAHHLEMQVIESVQSVAKWPGGNP